MCENSLYFFDPDLESNSYQSEITHELCTTPLKKNKKLMLKVELYILHIVRNLGVLLHHVITLVLNTGFNVIHFEVFKSFNVI